MLSTKPEATAIARFLQGVVAHAMAMLAEEGEYALDLRPVRRGGWPCGWITAPSICPDHLGDATGIK